MRTLKICVIAASLVLFAIPAIAAEYPREMPDIKNAPIQFTCKTPSLLFVKIYISKTYDVWISGRNKKEMVIEISTGDNIADNITQKKNFWFVPSANAWKRASEISEKEDAEIQQYSGGEATHEENLLLHSCVKSNLRNRRLLP